MEWKAPPADRSKSWISRSLEMQILLACNWTCHACDQLSQFSRVSFVKKGTMTLQQIEFFRHEMHRHNGYIGRIRLVGGEPSMHRNLGQIIMILRMLISEGHLGMIELVTNGSAVDKIQAAKAFNSNYELRVRTSGKSDKEKHHTANLLYTPESLGYEGKMCNAPWHCGISLNYWGYFPCSSGAGIARLFDNFADWQRLTLPAGDTYPWPKRPTTVERVWPNLQSLCNQCYHGLRDEDKVKCGTGDQPGQAELNKPGEAIAPHLQKWLDGKPVEWEAYGNRQAA